MYYLCSESDFAGGGVITLSMLTQGFPNFNKAINPHDVIQTQEPNLQYQKNKEVAILYMACVTQRKV